MNIDKSQREWRASDVIASAESRGAAGAIARASLDRRVPRIKSGVLAMTVQGSLA
jgi:hypothetical protein